VESATFHDPDDDRPEHTVNTASGTRTARFRRSTTLPAQRVPAADVPEPDVLVVLAWRPVASLLTGGHARGAYPVLESDGTVVGVLDLAELASRPDLHDRLAAQVCAPATPAHPLLQNLVLDNGRLVGVRGLRSA
jgi:hypothetical protein